MIKNLRFIFVFSLLLLLSSAGVLNAAPGSGTSGLVPDCSWLDCGLNEAFQMINKILSWIVLVSIPVAGIAIVWAGIKMVVYANNPGERQSALEILKVAGIGLIFVLAAYVIVKTLADFFIGDPTLKAKIGI